jgi:polysaccharide export outer membrane protein
MGDRSVKSMVHATCVAALCLGGCAGRTPGDGLPTAAFVGRQEGPGEDYVIGPLDGLSIFVWRNPDLSVKTQVRPDGRITTPLVADMPAVGKTPTMLAQDMQLVLSEYIRDPLVSVTVEGFSGTYSQQVRIVGATERPTAIPYRANMTLLDAMIAVGGLSQFASGNRARLVRPDHVSGIQREYRLKIDRLLKRGDSSANVRLQPGDVIIIPEASF